MRNQPPRQRSARQARGKPDSRTNQAFLGALKNAEMLWREKRLAEAEALLSRLLDAYPAHSKVNYLAGLVSADSGDIERAVGFFEKAIKSDRRNSQYHFDLGLLLNSLGRYAEAVTAFKNAIKAKPSVPEAHNCLGVALCGLKRPQEALKHYQAAIRMKPDYAEAYNNFGLACLELGHYRKAVEQLEKAQRLAPDDVEALKNLGTAFTSQGYLKMGLDCYRRALQMRPDDADILENIAAIYFARKMFRDTRTALDSILEINPKHQNAHELYGKLLFMLGEVEAAIDHYRKAIDVGEAKAELHYRLGDALVQVGRTAEAESHYRSALEAEPTYAAALVALSKKTGTYSREQTIERLESLVDLEEVSPQAVRDVHFLLGGLYDEAGVYDKAFGQYKAANELVEERLNRRHFSEFTDAIKQEFSSVKLKKLPVASNDSSVPVFVVGTPRTGKSLLGKILARHKAIVVPDEMRYIGTYFDIDMCREIQDYRDSIQAITKTLLDTVAEEYLYLCERAGDDPAARVVNTIPINFFHLGLIQLLFPYAKIINMQRDPRDMGLACYCKPFRHMDTYSFTSELADIAFFYRKYQELMEHWHKVLKIEILDVRYEQMVSDPGGTCRRILEFLGLEGDCRPKPVQDAGSVELAKASGDSEPLNTEYVGRWRHYEKQLGPLIAALSE